MFVSSAFGVSIHRRLLGLNALGYLTLTRRVDWNTQGH